MASVLALDPNHGGVIGDEFHSTRVIVDCTISEVEAASFPIPLVPNSDGLPPSELNTPQPNVSVRIPTRTSFGTAVHGDEIDIAITERFLGITGG